MSPDTKSALVRAIRTVLQVAIGAAVTWAVTRIPALSDWSDELTVALWAVATVAVAFVWRRFIDPTGVPSLVDPDTRAASGSA